MKNKFRQVVVGFIAGLINGLFGSGGGLFLVPAYSFLFHQSEKKTKSNVIFCILPMAFTSAIIYGSHSSVDYNTVFKCIFGELIGSIIGSKLLNKLSPIYLKIIFITFLIYASLNILIFS